MQSLSSRSHRRALFPPSSLESLHLLLMHLDLLHKHLISLLQRLQHFRPQRLLLDRDPAVLQSILDFRDEFPAGNGFACACKVVSRYTEGRNMSAHVHNPSAVLTLPEQLSICPSARADLTAPLHRTEFECALLDLVE